MTEYQTPTELPLQRSRLLSSPHSHVWKLQACGHPSLTRFEVVRLSPSQPETSVRDLVLLVRRCDQAPTGVDLRKICSGSRVDFR